MTSWIIQMGENDEDASIEEGSYFQVAEHFEFEDSAANDSRFQGVELIIPRLLGIWSISSSSI